MDGESKLLSFFSGLECFLADVDGKPVFLIQDGFLQGAFKEGLKFLF